MLVRPVDVLPERGGRVGGQGQAAPFPATSAPRSMARVLHQVTSMSQTLLFRNHIRREWARIVVGARRVATCAAVAGAWLGAWLLGVWSFGTLLVYSDARAGADEETIEPVGAADVVRVAAVDSAAAHEPPRPLVPRMPGAYGLDGHSRVLGDTLACPAIDLVDFTGDAVPLSPRARVTPPFAARLHELERVIVELASEFYGRRPSAILVAASYDCRSVSGKNQRLSEHALGNAIDITGFQFPPLAAEPAFEVRVDRHWHASGEAAGARHARFLRALTEALLARDVFRTLLGPAHPDHADHFHFDMAPEYYVDL